MERWDVCKYVRGGGERSDADGLFHDDSPPFLLLQVRFVTVRSLVYWYLTVRISGVCLLFLGHVHLGGAAEVSIYGDRDARQADGPSASFHDFIPSIVRIALRRQHIATQQCSVHFVSQTRYRVVYYGMISQLEPDARFAFRAIEPRLLPWTHRIHHSLTIRPVGKSHGVYPATRSTDTVTASEMSTTLLVR